MSVESLQMLFLAIQTIATALMMVITLGALLYAVKQVREAKKARVLAAYLSFESRLTVPEARKDRQYIYEHSYDIPSAITMEDQRILERVCVTFDLLGVLVREDLMYRPLVFKPFYDVIIKCWKKAFDFIEFQRKPNRRAPTYMKDFEYLYREAEKYRVSNGLPEITIYPPHRWEEANS